MELSVIGKGDVLSDILLLWPRGDEAPGTLRLLCCTPSTSVMILIGACLEVDKEDSVVFLDLKILNTP